MAFFEITFKSSVAKDLKKISQWQVRRILKAVERLAKDPFPPSSKKLIGSECTYRLRVGDYRVIYTVISKSLEVQLVGHRKDVYR